MRRITSIAFFSVLVMVALLSVTVLAATPVNINISRVDTSAFPDMNVEFSAWDAKGIPLSGL